MRQLKAYVLSIRHSWASWVKVDIVLAETREKARYMSYAPYSDVVATRAPWADHLLYDKFNNIVMDDESNLQVMQAFGFFNAE